MNVRFEVLDAVMYGLGFALFVLGQAHHSVNSGTNSLKSVRQYFQLQALNLATRAFFSVVFYTVILHNVEKMVASAGMDGTLLQPWAIAAISGYAANAILYQVLGFLPFLKNEVSQVAPPTDVENKANTATAGQP